MTVEQMESVLGKPDFSPTSISSVYADLGIEVIARDGEPVSAITCVRRIQNAPTVKECKYKTAEGIGIGSTESEIISAGCNPSPAMLPCSIVIRLTLYLDTTYNYGPQCDVVEILPNHR